MVIVHGIGRIGRHRDRAGGHDRQIRYCPFGPVFGHQPDPVARPDPQGHQPARKRGYLLGDFRPTLTLPLLVALRPEQRSGAVPLGLIEEHRGEITNGLVIHKPLLPITDCSAGSPGLPCRLRQHISGRLGKGVYA